MTKTVKIKVSTDYTKTPGFRHKSQGEFSGEDFREKFLEEYFIDPNDDRVIEIDLDGGLGYATSFLEEAFGGLARKFPNSNCIDRIKIISTEEPYLVEDIMSYIRDSSAK